MNVLNMFKIWNTTFNCKNVTKMVYIEKKICCFDIFDIQMQYMYQQSTGLADVSAMANWGLSSETRIMKICITDSNCSRKIPFKI